MAAAYLYRAYLSGSDAEKEEAIDYNRRDSVTEAITDFDPEDGTIFHVEGANRILSPETIDGVFSEKDPLEIEFPEDIESEPRTPDFVESYLEELGGQEKLPGTVVEILEGAGRETAFSITHGINKEVLEVLYHTRDGFVGEGFLNDDGLGYARTHGFLEKEDVIYTESGTSLSFYRSALDEETYEELEEEVK